MTDQNEIETYLYWWKHCPTLESALFLLKGKRVNAQRQVVPLCIYETIIRKVKGEDDLQFVDNTLSLSEVFAVS